MPHSDPDSLDHVPRRAVGMAKELRRMGLDVVVPAGEEGDATMSTDVRQVTDVVREITEIGKRARKISDDMRASMKDVDEALGIAEEVSTALRAAGAELRGVLGAQTNNPPRGDGDPGGGGPDAGAGGAGGPG